MRRFLVALTFLALAPRPSVAQLIHGTVRERGGGQPVTGAMVRLMDAYLAWTGELFLTASDGRYSLKVPGPGDYFLTVERIGFGSTRVGPLDLTRVQTLPFDVEVEAAPVRLEGLQVSAERRRCDLGDDPMGETQTLWGEVRKALDAARWTEKEAGLRIQVQRRTLELDPSGRHLTGEQRWTVTSFAGNSVRTLPPAELIEDGYVQERSDFVYYYGPDADVLLSDEFLDTHCFTVVEGPEERPGLVGLAFEPMNGRDLPDIDGVMWVDRATARLERVEFYYTGLGRRPGVEQARGEVLFEELSDGRWIVRDWSIRAPLMGLARQFVGGQLRERVMLVGVQEEGSEVVRAVGKNVDWRGNVSWGTVTGVVWDSVGMRGLPGAEVALGGRSRLALTDSAGRFRLDDVPPGSYLVTFGHDLVDSLGIAPPWQGVVVEPEGHVEVTLAIPAPNSLRAVHCHGSGAVVGLVRDERGTPLPGAVVSAEGRVAPGGMPRSAVTDGAGGYWICIDPPADALALVARFGPWSSDTVRVQPPDSGFVVTDLSVPLRTAALPEEAVGAGRPAVVGTVVEAQTRAPVEGVRVQLLSEAGEVVAQALSDARGRVLLQPEEPGAFDLRTERMGFAPTAAPLELGPGTRRLEIRLASEAIPLEEMVVEVRGTSLGLEREGFYLRERTGQGIMLDRDVIQALAPVATGDILRRQPGVTPGPSSRGNTTRRFFVFRRATAAHDSCLPAVFLDGQIVRQGGPIRDPDTEGRMTLDEIVPAQDIEGMEIYDSPSSVPAQFTGPGAACGVVVIWTRRGIGD